MFLKLIKWSDCEYTLIWQVHHLVMDAWSASIAFKSVLELYQDDAKLPELQKKQLLPFSDYVQYSNSTEFDELQNYWKSYLNHVVKSNLNIPVPYYVRLRQTNVKLRQSGDPLLVSKQATYGINQCVWNKEKSHSVREFCAANAITLAGFIHGAWAILISAYSDTRTPYFGLSLIHI